MSYDFDLIVIGSGPAGEKAAVKAAYFGKRVALIERNAAVGGACSTGGLPSKILRESALAYSGARRRLVDVFPAPPRQRMKMASFLKAVDVVCEARNQRIQANLDRHGVECILGTAAFDDAHTLSVRADAGERRVSAAFIVIATGSRPVRPPAFPFDDRRVFCSDTILTMDELPRSMTVVGGGAIGAEYASLFAALDVDVHLVEARPRIAGFLDAEIGNRLVAELQRRGLLVHLGQRVADCKVAGTVVVATHLGARLESEVLLFSGGRAANTESLNLEMVGVRVGRLGRPDVDASFRTSVEHIFAVGDVVGFPALASTSMEQGRVAVGQAFALNEAPQDRPDVAYPQNATYPLMPYGLYTIPAAAMVGQTEEQARAAGHDCVVGRSRYADHDRGRLLGDIDGMLKLICDRRTRAVLGVHIIGEGAEELIHLGQACMHFGGTLSYFIRSVFNFPSMTALYKAAAYDALSQCAGAQTRMAHDELLE